jgi:hypothetical protein
MVYLFIILPTMVRYLLYVGDMLVVFVDRPKTAIVA